MVSLQKILQGVSIRQTAGVLPEAIDQLRFDSREVNPGDLFVAVRGTRTDGHQYIASVAARGAALVVCEELPAEAGEQCPYLVVDNSAHALGIMAANYYGNPSQQLKLVGITGTNGKTSSVTMLHHLFESLGYRAGMLSTISNKIGEREVASTHTTGDALQINRLLREMVDAGCEYAFMEVSSHALVQHRVSGLHFQGALFSNITHDHLDYHGSFAAYIDAKKMFFDRLTADAFALVNIDDRHGRVMVQNTQARIKTYAIRSMADYRCRILENSFEGLKLDINNRELWVPLAGTFNAYNILVVYATAMELGMSSEEVLTRLSEIHTAEGRFEALVSRSGIIAIVDYAHTPDALENVLKTIHDVRTGAEQLITVVGAGGNRDKGKRPIMAALAAKLSDRVILTSDNPRNEEPEAILKDMEQGLSPDMRRKTLTIVNRKEAIKTACLLARKGDIILVAGKGHEKYQEIKGVRHHFDDKEVLKEILNQD